MIEALIENSLLGTASEAAIKELAELVTVRSFKAEGEIVFEGDVAGDVFLILDGSVHLHAISKFGKVVSYARLTKGSYFGELSVFDDQARPYAASAETECQLGVIDGGEFRRLVLAYPEIGLSIIQKLAADVRASNDRIFSLTLLNGTGRVCMEILNLSEPDPARLDAVRVFPFPTQQDLSERVGVARETVARTLKKLTEETVIERKGRVLWIRDIDRLEAMVAK
tara:strand:- start:951 stop:1625 length:675 start_codon:yes stop_codon:yes gene_type:complete